jgi:uncharacterized repeat protein (TIGR03847 family)
VDAGKAKYQFGQASKVTAEAIGEPGQRTFRLDLESGAASASLWLEKEQLNQLGLYIQEIVSSLGDADKGGGGDAPEPPWSGGLTNVEFKVGRLALGQDRASNCLLLLTYDVEDPDDSEATLSFWITLKQGEELAEEAIRVCAAGRPRCQLCSQPINPEGHMCIRANGHGPLAI